MEGDGTLIRYPGGFWQSPNCEKTEQWLTGNIAPAGDSVGVQTILALENKGLVVRTNQYPEEWRDTRRITALGNKALGTID